MQDILAQPLKSQIHKDPEASMAKSVPNQCRRRYDGLLEHSDREYEYGNINPYMKTLKRAVRVRGDFSMNFTTSMPDSRLTVLLAEASADGSMGFC